MEAIPRLLKDIESAKLIPILKDMRVLTSDDATQILQLDSVILQNEMLVKILDKDPTTKTFEKLCEALETSGQQNLAAIVKTEFLPVDDHQESFRGCDAVIHPNEERGQSPQGKSNISGLQVFPPHYARSPELENEQRGSSDEPAEEVSTEIEISSVSQLTIRNCLSENVDLHNIIMNFCRNDLTSLQNDVLDSDSNVQVHALRQFIAVINMFHAHIDCSIVFGDHDTITISAVSLPSYYSRQAKVQRFSRKIVALQRALLVLNYGNMFHTRRVIKQLLKDFHQEIVWLLVSLESGPVQQECPNTHMDELCYVVQMDKDSD